MLLLIEIAISFALLPVLCHSLRQEYQSIIMHGASASAQEILPISRNSFYKSLDYPDWFDPNVNEWQYMNYDEGSQIDETNSMYVHNTYGDLLLLAQVAQECILGGSTCPSFKRWFGGNDPQKINSIFMRIVYYHYDPPGWQATDTLYHATYLVNDPSDKDYCTTHPNTVAYTYYKLGQWHYCKTDMPNLATLKANGCAALKNYITIDSSPAAGTHLHELIHWVKIGDYVLGEHITDIEYSPYAAFTLNDTEKLLNAQNYKYFALDAYFSQVCPAPFQDPPRPVLGDPDHPGSGYWPSEPDDLPTPPKAARERLGTEEL